MENQDKRPVYMGTFVKNNKQFENNLAHLQEKLRNTSRIINKHKRMIYWILGISIVNIGLSILAIL
jgi:hypothetical protein